MDDNKFDLSKTSAAIIFNQDMSVELMLPKMSDDETIDFDTNQNIFVAMAITSLVDDPDFRRFVGGKMQKMLETADGMRKADEEAPMCSPNSCEGGCCGPKGGNEPDEGKDPGDGS